MPAKRYSNRAEAARAWKDNNRKRWGQEDPYAAPGEKTCSTCRMSKPKLNFARALTTKDGLQGRCNDCIFSRHAQDPRPRMLSNAKIRATKKGLDFSISLEDVEVPRFCPVLGIPLQATKGLSPGSPSLDRIDNSKGYVKGNVLVVSFRANDLKKDATVEELERVLDYMRRLPSPP